jgi:hypothetical protein
MAAAGAGVSVMAQSHNHVRFLLLVLAALSSFVMSCSRAGAQPLHHEAGTNCSADGAAQLSGKPVVSISPIEANRIIANEAVALWNGTSTQVRLPAGQKLFCRKVDGKWRHVSVVGQQEDTATAALLDVQDERMRTATHIVGIEKEFENILGHKAQGRYALYSVGKFEARGSFAPENGLVSLHPDVLGATGTAEGTILHESVGHALFYRGCAVRAKDACDINRNSLISNIINEAHSFMLQYSYALFMYYLKDDFSHLADSHTSYDGSRYSIFLAQIFVSNPSDVFQMRRTGTVPDELRTKILFALLRTPTKAHMTIYGKYSATFGTEQDLIGSLNRVHGLSDEHRQEAARIVRGSAWYQELSKHHRLNEPLINAFIEKSQASGQR